MRSSKMMTTFPPLSPPPMMTTTTTKKKKRAKTKTTTVTVPHSSPLRIGLFGAAVVVGFVLVLFRLVCDDFLTVLSLLRTTTSTATTMTTTMTTGRRRSGKRITSWSALPFVRAGPATRAPFVEIQPDGEHTPPLRVHGDERYHYVTDADGYLVVRDVESGWYVYAGGDDDGDGDDDDDHDGGGGRRARERDAKEEMEVEKMRGDESIPFGRALGLGRVRGRGRFARSTAANAAARTRPGPRAGTLRVGRDSPAKAGLRTAEEMGMHADRRKTRVFSSSFGDGDNDDEIERRRTDDNDEESSAAARLRRRLTRDRRRLGRLRRAQQFGFGKGGEESAPEELLKVLVIPFRFADHKDRTMTPTKDIEALFNGERSEIDGSFDDRIIPTGSVRTAFREYSYGKLHVEATVLPNWIDVSYTEMYSAAGVAGYTSNEILDPLREALDAAWYDEGQSVSSYDGVCFVHSGYAAEFGSTDCDGRESSDRVWVHSRTMSYVDPSTAAGERHLLTYTVASAFWGTCGTDIARVAMQTHEVGHLLGLDDLYATRGIGVGYFDTMGYVWGMDNSQRYPPHLSAYSKIEVGWITPTVIDDNGMYASLAIESAPQAYRVDWGYKFGEYLLIENRQPIGYDRQLIGGGGLVIYHIDERAPGQSRPGYPGQISDDGREWPHNGAHYMVAVVQQDGRYDLERDNNVGDETDVWSAETTGWAENEGDDDDGGQGLGPGGVDGDGGPYPNTDSYQRGYVQSIGLRFDMFSESDSIITFRVTGFPAPFPTAEAGAEMEAGAEAGSAFAVTAAAPTHRPTYDSTDTPTVALTDPPINPPTGAPMGAPTPGPTIVPTAMPTRNATTAPTDAPTDAPTFESTSGPTHVPTMSRPSAFPTSSPTDRHTAVPTSTSKLTSGEPTGATNASLSTTTTTTILMTSSPELELELQLTSTRPFVAPSVAPSAAEDDLTGGPAGSGESIKGKKEVGLASMYAGGNGNAEPTADPTMAPTEGMKVGAIIEESRGRPSPCRFLLLGTWEISSLMVALSFLLL